ncbi:hypothetical protein PIB30_051412 [Stylosanthes scabra]|uniref:Uncharacterized protein n=1 Tax=Stylosanthes scabra TaxID=79078 RepID=A0ABU6WG48_9FABA|nr:hypothetical protein [Stylosanthes scabra]
MIVKHDCCAMRMLPISNKFDVFKLNKNAKEWSRIHSLEDYAVMIGHSSSVQMFPGEVLINFRMAVASSHGVLLQWRPEDPDPYRNVSMHHLGSMYIKLLGCKLLTGTTSQALWEIL